MKIHEIFMSFAAAKVWNSLSLSIFDSLKKHSCILNLYKPFQKETKINELRQNFAKFYQSLFLTILFRKRTGIFYVSIKNTSLFEKLKHFKKNLI